MRLALKRQPAAAAMANAEPGPHPAAPTYGLPHGMGDLEGLHPDAAEGTLAAAGLRMPLAPSSAGDARW